VKSWRISSSRDRRARQSIDYYENDKLFETLEACKSFNSGTDAEGGTKVKKKLRLKHEKLFRGAKGERKYQFS
jgi:hypothetical protein